METTQSNRHFLPGAGHDFFLPLYDPLAKLFGTDRARRVLLNQAKLGPSQRVLDVGCGTGTLATLIKRTHPDVVVVGIDPDGNALARARKKSERAHLAIRFEQGFADALGYREASFDHVFSSLMFHHLPSGEKLEMLREVHRVLKPGGQLHLLDFDGKGRGLVGHLLHGRPLLADNTTPKVLALMADAGFANPRCVATDSLLLGGIAYYLAERASS